MTEKINVTILYTTVEKCEVGGFIYNSTERLLKNNLSSVTLDMWR